LHIVLVTLELRPSIEDLFLVFLFAKSPIVSICFFQYLPVPSVMPHPAEIERKERVMPLRRNASKNLHFLVVVASLPARGSGEGVRKGLERVGGAIFKELLLFHELAIWPFWCFWPVRK
jgi:hypothetical protein